MESIKLLKRAEQEALKALAAEKEPELKFQRRGGSRYWDEGAYREIFDVHFRVWKRIAYYDVLLASDTGSLLSCSNSAAIAQVKFGSISGQEAIRIAEAEAKKHIPADTSTPQVRDIIEQGNALILVSWRSLSTGETIEITVHPGTKTICRIQRKFYPSANQ